MDTRSWLAEQNEVDEEEWEEEREKIGGEGMGWGEEKRRWVMLGEGRRTRTRKESREPIPV